jgi:hypothetical protein
MCAYQVSGKLGICPSYTKNTKKCLVQSLSLVPNLIFFTQNIGFAWNYFVNTQNMNMYARHFLSFFLKFYNTLKSIFKTRSIHSWMQKILCPYFTELGYILPQTIFFLGKTRQYLNDPERLDCIYFYPNSISSVVCRFVNKLTWQIQKMMIVSNIFTRVNKMFASSKAFTSLKKCLAGKNLDGSS